MRLMNAHTYELEEFLTVPRPPYAILSHTWGKDRDEVTFSDLAERRVKRTGAWVPKVEGCCRRAVEDGYGYVWIDTCCIDKTNSVELSEAINSMFRWYEEAAICYAILSDVPVSDNGRSPESKIFSSRWFERGWTLQELLAPRQLRFYNAGWVCLGTKAERCTTVEKITGIPSSFMLGISSLHHANVAQRMSWAARRTTKRIEDSAYCLLGIFGVTMPMIYGEGVEAFRRLQKEIMDRTHDDSILAWGLGTSSTRTTTERRANCILASSPADFANCGRIVTRSHTAMPDNTISISGGFLRLQLPMLQTQDGSQFGLLTCGPDHDAAQVVGIPLEPATSIAGSREYIRPRARQAGLLPRPSSKAPAELLYIRDEQRTTQLLRPPREPCWFHIEEPSIPNLTLVDVEPKTSWHQDRSLIDASIEADQENVAQRMLARFRDDGGSVQLHDFVVALETDRRAGRSQRWCRLMICSRETLLEDIAQYLDRTLPVASRVASGSSRYQQERWQQQAATNTRLNLTATLRSDAMRQMLIVRLDTVLDVPMETIDVTAELQEVRMREEELKLSLEQSDLMIKQNVQLRTVEEKKAAIDAKREQLGLVKAKLKTLENERDSITASLEQDLGELQVVSLDCQTIEHRLVVVGDAVNALRNTLKDKYPDETAADPPEESILAFVEKNHQSLSEFSLQNAPKSMQENRENRIPPQGEPKSLQGDHQGRAQLHTPDHLAEGDRNHLVWAIKNNRVAAFREMLGRAIGIEGKTGQVFALSHIADGEIKHTLLTYAAATGKTDMLQLLLGAGIDTDQRSSANMTALMSAARNGHHDAATALLDAGANVETRGGDGNDWTALWFAVRGSHEDIVRLLISRGADWTYRDPKNRTVLFLARAVGNEPVVRLLQLTGSSPLARDRHSLRPAEYRLGSSNKEVVQAREIWMIR